VLSPAIEEISDASLHFESQRVGLGNEFWCAIDDVLSQIEANPLRFAKSEFTTAEIDIRFAIVARFKYVVHFAINVDEIEIVSVAHGARKPGYWLRRSGT
jgi:toxin ParE1/3/4